VGFARRVRVLPLVALAVLLTVRHHVDAARVAQADREAEFVELIKSTYDRMREGPPEEAAAFFHFTRAEERALIVPRVAAVLRDWNALRPEPARPDEDHDDEDNDGRGARPMALEFVGMPVEPPVQFDEVSVSPDGERASCDTYDEGTVCSFRKVDGKWLWDGDAQFGLEGPESAGPLAKYLTAVGGALAEVQRVRKESPDAAHGDPAIEVDRQVCTAVMAKHLTDLATPNPPLPKAVAEAERLADGVGRISGLAVTRDGKLAATGAVSAAVPLRLWNLDAKTFDRALVPSKDVLFDVTQVAFTPDGSQLVGVGTSWSAGSVLRSASEGSLDERGYEVLDPAHVVWVFDVATGREVHRFELRDALDQSLAVSPDGTSIGVCGPFFTAVFDLRTGNTRFQSRPAGGSAVALGAEDTLYVQRLGDTVDVIDLKTGKEVRSFPLDQQRARRPMTTLAIGPSGRTLAVATMTGVTAYEIATGREFRHYALPPVGGLNRVNAITISGDGTKVLGACGLFSLDKGPLSPFVAAIVPADPSRVACLWDAKDARLIKAYVGHAKAVSGAVFLPGERQILTSSTDGTLRIWPVP
jgi:WD40 repeat protein